MRTEDLDKIPAKDLLHALAWWGIGAEVPMVEESDDEFEAADVRPRYAETVKAYDTLLDRVARLEARGKPKPPTQQMYEIAIECLTSAQPYLPGGRLEVLTQRLRELGRLVK